MTGKRKSDDQHFVKKLFLKIILQGMDFEDGFLIFNMDKVPLSFDIPPTRTIDVQRTNSIQVAFIEQIVLQNFFYSSYVVVQVV